LEKEVWMRRSAGALLLEVSLSTCLLAALLDGSPARGQTGLAVDNARVIAMTKLGLGDEVIIARIKTSPCRFALTDDDLVALKRAGVSDKVITAMLEASVLTSPRVSVDGRPLALRSLAQSRVVGGLGKNLSLGIRSTKTKALLLGRHANVYAAPEPNIILELPPEDSVDNYVLVRMASKGDRREIEVAPASAGTGSRAGIRSEDAIRMLLQPLGGRRYQLTPAKRLKRGEYLLYVLGSADANKGIYGRGYDFSVQ
jgi:hypothetical protein